MHLRTHLPALALLIALASLAPAASARPLPEVGVVCVPEFFLPCAVVDLVPGIPKVTSPGTTNLGPLDAPARAVLAGDASPPTFSGLGFGCAQDTQTSKLCSGDYFGYLDGVVRSAPMPAPGLACVPESPVCRLGVSARDAPVAQP